MNQSESADEVTKTHKLSGKSTLCEGGVNKRSRHLIYGLRAYRYAGDMTLMQALGRELERSSGVNLIESGQSKKHLFEKQQQGKPERKGLCN